MIQYTFKNFTKSSQYIKEFVLLTVAVPAAFLKRTFEVPPYFEWYDDDWH